MTAEIVDWLQDFLASLPDDDTPVPSMPELDIESLLAGRIRNGGDAGGNESDDEDVAEQLRNIDDGSGLDNAKSRRRSHLHVGTDFHSVVDKDLENVVADGSDYGEELTPGEALLEFGFDFDHAVVALSHAPVVTTASVDEIVTVGSSDSTVTAAYTPVYSLESSDDLDNARSPAAAVVYSLGSFSLDYSSRAPTRSFDNNTDLRCAVGLQRRATSAAMPGIDHTRLSIGNSVPIKQSVRHSVVPTLGIDRLTVSAPNSANDVLDGLSLSQRDQFIRTKVLTLKIIRIIIGIQ